MPSDASNAADSAAAPPLRRNKTGGLLHWLRAHRWTTALVAGLCLAPVAAWGVLSSYTPRYQASALLMIEDAAPYIAFDNARELSRSSFAETQLALLRSSLVLQPVLSQPKIAAQRDIAGSVDPMPALRRNLAVTRIGSSELYNIAYTSRSPQDAADVVNAIVEHYLRIQYENEDARTSRVVELLDQERLRRQAEVDRLRRELMKLGEGLTGQDPFVRSSKLPAKSPAASAAYDQIIRLELDRVVLQAQLEALGEKDSLNPDATRTDDGESASREAIDALLRRRQTALAELSELADEIKSKFAGEDSAASSIPDRLERLVQSERAAFDELQQNLLEINGRRQRASRRAEIERLEQELRLVEAKKVALEKRFYDLVARAQADGEAAVEFEFKRAELKREEAIFEMIAARSLAIQTESRAPARVSVKQKAALPVQPVDGPPYDWAVVVGALAMFAPFAAASIVGAPGSRA